MASLGAVVARNVRAERARRGWDQTYLGDLAGWSRSTVSTLESGQRKLLLDDLPILCRSFKIPMAKLVEGADRADLEALNLRWHPDDA